MSLRPLLFLLLALALIPPAEGAAAAKGATAAKGGSAVKWARVPQRYLLERFILAEGAKPEQHRVSLVLMPRNAPRIVTSSGDRSVDLVAVRIARDMVAQDPRLVALAKSKELEFHLELVPPRVARESRASGLFVGADYTKTEGGASAFVPNPPIPDSTSKYSSGGRDVRLHVRFDATTGLCDRSILIEPTDAKDLNVYCLFWPIYHWKLMKPTGKTEHLSQALYQRGIM